MSTCSWSVNPACCQAIWDAATTDAQNAATAWATDVLWAATGRQFGTCPVVVRPCLNEGQWGWFFYNNGYGDFLGWLPYIWAGEWFNGCGCGFGNCTLHPFTKVSLLGPVAGVSAVTIGGIVLDPSTYRVDGQQFLIRQDGLTWPLVQHLNDPAGELNTWSIAYYRGTPVPQSLLNAAGTLACEYLKACASDPSCRLSSRVTSIIRQGVQMTMVPLDDLLAKGYTGLEEVDQLIRSFNPSALTHRLRLFSPDVERNTVTTWTSS